jgi:glycosyltransferase involved in cell wall biosynthesis
MLLAREGRPAPPPLAGDVAPQAAGPEIVLDLSRLLSRLLHPTPTGVDRVELAYARTLPRRAPGRVRFAAVHPSGRYGRLDERAVARFLDECAHRWEHAQDERAAARWRHALAHGWGLRPRAVPPPAGPRVLLQVSPHHLDRPAVVAAKLARERARFVCLVHDLIPITHPEFARVDGRVRHERRMATLRDQAHGLLANSRATAEAFAAWAGPGFTRPLRSAPLGVEADRTAAPSPFAGSDYFVCLGTIEPRKNHLLLLNIWRSLAAMLGPARTPRLLLIGRRGWENENVLDLLDRCTPLRGVAVELSRLPDAQVRTLLRGARALLMPSFAEGFGLPVAEALALGTPVLASDIPAHREAGGDVPDYLDPLDGAGWRAAILAYAARDGAARTAQLARLAAWRAPGWDAPVDAALALAAEVAAA